MLNSLCPIMPSANIDATEKFYASLKFKTAYKDEHYLLMIRDKAEVHFFHQPGHDPARCDHGAYLRPEDVDAFSAEVEKLGLPSQNAFPKFSPAEDKDWGMREAVLWDPDGNLIRAGVPIED